VASDQQLGVIVLWTDTRPEGKKQATQHLHSVRGKFIEDNQEFVVFCPADAKAQDPAISGRHIVFNHNRGWTNVLMTQLPECQPRNTVGATAYTPAIDQGLVVFASAKHRWEAWSGDGAPPASWIGDILAYEVDGPDITFDVTCSEQANQGQPAVSGTVVVWQEARQAWGWSDYGIFKRDVDMDPVPVRICRNKGAAACYPAICGSIIVWQDNRSGNWDIYGHNLATAQEFAICAGPGNQQLPAIAGQTIVWQDDRNGNWDIYGHDLTSGKTFPIYQGKGDQTQPDIHHNVVVWTDNRHGNNDIYINTGKQY